MQDNLPLTISPGQIYTTRDVLDVARHRRQIKITCRAQEQTEISRQTLIRAQREGLQVYGCNTPYGARVNAGAPTEQDDRRKQKNLALTLNCSSGPLLQEEWVRAAMLVRLFTLSQGYSGVRPIVLDELCLALNKNDMPEIPEVGSIGASGDLSPSSYIALHLKKRITLEGREVLALLNGTSVMTGILASVIEDLLYLHHFTYGMFAIFFQCLEGVGEVFDEELHDLKKHNMQKVMAKVFRELLDGSQLLDTVEGRALKEEPIQDPYSLRCLAQETGPDLYAIEEARTLVERELRSVSDNPVIMYGDAEMPIRHGGHFDGRWITLAVNSTNFSIQGTAQLINAYIQRISSSKLNGLLPDYLVAHNDGFNNGLQGLNLTSSAVHIEIMRLLIPIQLFAGRSYENFNQDVVSLGMHAAVATGKAVDHLRSNIARLAIFARQAIGIRGVAEKLSPATKKIYDTLCTQIPFVGEDRSLHGDIALLEKLLIHHEL